MDGVVRKDDPPTLGAIDHTGLQQCVDIAMHGFDIPADAAGDSSD